MHLIRFHTELFFIPLLFCMIPNYAVSFELFHILILKRVPREDLFFSEGAVKSLQNYSSASTLLTKLLIEHLSP